MQQSRSGRRCRQRREYQFNVTLAALPAVAGESPVLTVQSLTPGISKTL